MGNPLDILGTTAATEQGRRKVYTFFDGEREERVFMGPTDAVETLYNLYKTVAGYNPDYDVVEFDPGRGKGTLRISKVEDGEAVYELYPNEILKPIALHKYFAITATAVTADEMATINQNIPLATPAASTGLTGKALTLYKYMLWGMEEYLETGYVLRETKNVSKRSTVAASYTGVNTVVTPPSTSAVNSLIGTLPSGEWLKKAPVVRMIGKRRWQIVTEWWWAEKWAAIYGGSWTP